MNNPISYISRSYEQIKRDVLTSLRSFAPEITDFNSSNILVKLIEVYAGIADMISYYTDRVANETFLMTLKRYSSAVKFAKAYDYRIKACFPAEVSQRFYVNIAATSNITIPLGTVVGTSDNIFFETTQVGTILVGQTETFIPCIQRSRFTVTPSPNTSGLASQVIVLEGNIVDGTVEVSINSEYYFSVETFAFSTAVDKHFVQSVNENGQVIITFGNGINGIIPPTAQPISISYFVCEGTNGNVSELNINRVISTGLSVFTENLDRASGGTNIEDLETIRRKLPLFVRTLERAVTEKDFQNVTELAVGVEKAGIIHECGEPTKIFIAPTSGGIAPPSLIASVTNYLNLRKIIGINIEVATVGVIILEYNITATALPQFTNTDVRNAIIANLLAFHSAKTQDVQGTLYISDVYQIIENSLGVLRSVVNQIDIRPYARSLNNNVVLNWTRIVRSGSTTTKKWRIEIINATEFELYQDVTLIGTYNIGSVVSLTDIEFTVLGTYTIGFEWEFYTYNYLTKYSDILTLAEPSMLLTYTENINLTVTGGLD